MLSTSFHVQKPCADLGRREVLSDPLSHLMSSGLHGDLGDLSIHNTDCTVLLSLECWISNNLSWMRLVPLALKVGKTCTFM